MTLALAGPGLVALASRHYVGAAATVATAGPWLAVFTSLIFAVAAIARWGEGLGAAEVGFGRLGWATAPSAIGLALFFIFVFGPAAYWVLMRLPLGSFGGGAAVLAAPHR